MDAQTAGSRYESRLSTTSQLIGPYVCMYTKLVAKHTKLIAKHTELIEVAKWFSVKIQAEANWCDFPSIISLSYIKLNYIYMCTGGE